MSKTADALYKMTAKPRKEKDTAANWLKINFY
jgi:hypothetical protein